MATTQTVGLTWDGMLSIDGTSLHGMFEPLPFSFEETVARLITLSGQAPETMNTDAYKVSVEFTGTFNGHTFTLYDYKGDRALHIGGRDGLPVKALILWLTEALQGVQPTDYTATEHYDDSDGLVHGFKVRR